MNKEKYIKHLNKGMSLYESGEYKKAIEEYRQAIRFNDKDIGARMDIARCYVKTGELRQAKTALQNMSPRVGRRIVTGAYYRLWSYIAAEEERYDVAFACLKFSQRVNWTFSGFMEKIWVRFHCRAKVTWRDIIPLLKSYDIPVIFDLQWGRR